MCVKNRILCLLLATGMAFSLAVSPAWAQSATELSKQCEEALKKTPNKESEKLCADGNKLLKEGKEAEATAKFSQGLEKLGVKTKKM